MAGMTFFTRWLEKLKFLYRTYCPVCIEIWCWSKRRLFKPTAPYFLRVWYFLVASIKWLFWPIGKFLYFVFYLIRSIFSLISVLVESSLRGIQNFTDDLKGKDVAIFVLSIVLVSVLGLNKVIEEGKKGNAKLGKGYLTKLHDGDNEYSRNLVPFGELTADVDIEKIETEEEADVVRQKLVRELKKYQKFYGILAIIFLVLVFRGLKIKPPRRKK